MVKPEIKIVRAQPDDASVLTNIAFAAKRHWGYPENWIRQWSKELSVTAVYITKYPTYTAIIGEKPVGFCAVTFKPREALLDHLWVWIATLSSRGIRGFSE